MPGQLRFEIAEWLDDPNALECPEAATMCRLRIQANDHCLTKVYDQRARTIREHIRVPSLRIAEWLLMNMWRLKWEPSMPDRTTLSWREAHDLAAVDGEYAWPSVQIFSGGDSIRVQTRVVEIDRVSPVQYLQPKVSVDLEPSAFEESIRGFCQEVKLRLSEVVPEYRDLDELFSEYESERQDPSLSERYKLEALAGFDPAEMSFFEEAFQFRKDNGAHAASELLATVQGQEARFREAIEDVQKIRTSKEQIDLGRFQEANMRRDANEAPWQYGVRLAREARRILEKPSGPLSTEYLSELLGADFRKFPTSQVRHVLGGAEMTSTHPTFMCSSTRHAIQQDGSKSGGW